MKFIIKYGSNIRNNQLLYLEDECSFYIENKNKNIELELMINKIALQISNSEVVSLNGFCGLSKSMESNYMTPKYKKGLLRVEHNLEKGFAYNINDDFQYEYTVNINFKTGWVCIGDPKIKKNAVEFIDCCVAVIDDNGGFVSLWLKPKLLPESL